jgi:hypothetical protein
MPLDVIRANARTAAINDAFALIGRAGDSKMPASKLNTEPVAWEYYAASHLNRIAEARKKAAQAAAVKAGLMFDPEKAPLAVGTNALVYAGDVVEIAVSVTTPASRLDTAAFVDDLEKSGVARKLLDRLVTKHTHESRAPHKFTATLATSAPALPAASAPALPAASAPALPAATG